MTKYISGVSRYLDPTLTGFESVVFQKGKGLLDSELNLIQDLQNIQVLPSGVLSNQKDIFDDFIFNSTPNTLTIKPFNVRINNRKIPIAYTNDNTGNNKITLPNPNGQTHFIFLEAWRALVQPATKATARLRVGEGISASEIVTIDGVDFEADVDFDIGASKYETALNLSNAINTNGVCIADSKGTDFVFLTLDSNATITTTSAFVDIDPASGYSPSINKPDDDHIYIHGNIQSTTWVEDDLIDSVLNKETTKRVQWQYCFRVIENYNYVQNPKGFDPTTVFAQGSNPTPNITYTYQQSSSDSGLWFSGDGSETSSTDLNTIDGYIYAIPICYVNRRYVSIGSQIQNYALLSTHTGVTKKLISNPNTTTMTIPAGVSDRPDGLFADVIVANDVTDLRKKIISSLSPNETEKQLQYLLDGNLNTWQSRGDTLFPLGASGVGAKTLICDELSWTGAYTNGTRIGGIDGVIRHRFNSSPTVAFFVIGIEPTTGVYTINFDNDGALESQPLVSMTVTTDTNGYWTENDTIEIAFTDPDLTNSKYLPTNTTITDVVQAWHDDGYQNSGSTTTVFFKSIEGLGIHSNNILLTLDANNSVANGGFSSSISPPNYVLVKETGGVTNGSPRKIYVKLAISYPEGNGLSATPYETLTPSNMVYYDAQPIISRASEVNGANLDYGPIVKFRPTGYRDVSVTYVKTETTIDLVSQDNQTIRLPEPFFIDATHKVYVRDMSGIGEDALTTYYLYFKFANSIGKYFYIYQKDSVNGQDVRIAKTLTLFNFDGGNQEVLLKRGQLSYNNYGFDTVAYTNPSDVPNASIQLQTGKTYYLRFYGLQDTAGADVQISMVDSISGAGSYTNLFSVDNNLESNTYYSFVAENNPTFTPLVTATEQPTTTSLLVDENNTIPYTEIDLYLDYPSNAKSQNERFSIYSIDGSNVYVEPITLIDDGGVFYVEDIGGSYPVYRPSQNSAYTGFTTQTRFGTFKMYPNKTYYVQFDTDYDDTGFDNFIFGIRLDPSNLSLYQVRPFDLTSTNAPLTYYFRMLISGSNGLITPTLNVASPLPVSPTYSISEEILYNDVGVEGGVFSTPNSSECLVYFNGSNLGQSRVRVTYYPIKPVNFYSLIYYNTVLPQTCGSHNGVATSYLPNELELEILQVSNNLYAIQIGKGSNSIGFPYHSPSDPIAIHPDVDISEWELRANSRIDLGNFNANTGLLKLNSLVPIDLNTNIILNTLEKDLAGRVGYTDATDYYPATISQPLGTIARHKNVVAMLCKVKESNSTLTANEIVLVVISRLSNVDEKDNKVAIGDGQTIVSLYYPKNRIIGE